MPIHDDLGKRMKEYYEQIPKTKLMRRTPVAIRLDGKAFHTFTRGFQKPFDEILIKTMQKTMKYLCENIQGCVLGYTQSDEITLILVDYKKLNSSAWFDYEIQKMCSIAASMATMAFNKSFEKNVIEYVDSVSCLQDFDIEEKYLHTLESAVRKGAMFDARAFNIPKEEVTNLLYWRQLDCMRNSVSMVGQANFSHRELQNKSRNDIKEMLLAKGINWEELPIYLQCGSCCIKEKYFIPCENGKDIKYPEGCSDPMTDDEIEYGVWRTHWIIDREIPIFKNEGREYIEKLINFNGE